MEYTTHFSVEGVTTSRIKFDAGTQEAEACTRVARGPRKEKDAISVNEEVEEARVHVCKFLEEPEPC